MPDFIISCVKTLFKIYLERVLRNWKKKCQPMGIPIQNTYVYSLNFADDQVLLAQDHDDMEYMARKLKEGYEKRGLTMNLEKTKYVCLGEGKEILKSEGGEEIKPCTECNYSGVVSRPDPGGERIMDVALCRGEARNSVRTWR